jgi:hypothetical protein
MANLVKRMDGGNHPRRHVPAVEDGAVDLEHRLPGELGQFAQEPAVESEEDPLVSGDGEDELSVRRGR